MAKIVYNKLVRDKIPSIILADSKTPVTRILNDEEYKRALLEKLVEEAKELLESYADLGERADVAEVLKALDGVFAFDERAVESARVAKAEKRGGFEGRIFLKETLTHD